MGGGGRGRGARGTEASSRRGSCAPPSLPPRTPPPPVHESACLPFLRSQRLRSSPNPLSRALPCESSSPSASTSTTLLRPFDSRSCSMRLGFDKVPRGSPHSLSRTLRWCARRRRRGDGCGRTSGLAARSPHVLAAAAHALCASSRARPNRRKATGDRGLERSALRALLATRSRLPSLARDTRQNALIECLYCMKSSSTSSTAPPQHAGLETGIRTLVARPLRLVSCATRGRASAVRAWRQELQ